MAFADNLKAIRKTSNISQEDLAELLDVSRQAVSKWEQGIGYPEVEKLLLLSKRLNISLDDLMSNSEDAGHLAAELNAPSASAGSEEQDSEKKKSGKKKRNTLILCAGIAVVLLVSAAHAWALFLAPNEVEQTHTAAFTRVENGIVVARYADSIVIQSDHVVYPGLGKSHPDAQLYYVFYVDKDTVIENADGSKATSMFDIASGDKVEAGFPVDADYEPLPQRKNGMTLSNRTDILLSSIKVLSKAEVNNGD